MDDHQREDVLVKDDGGGGGGQINSDGGHTDSDGHFKGDGGGGHNGGSCAGCLSILTWLPRKWKEKTGVQSSVTPQLLAALSGSLKKKFIISLIFTSLKKYIYRKHCLN